MSRKRLYLLGPALIALIASALFAAPGCGADTCQGARSKICEKACACGSKCSVNGINFDSKSACSLTFGGECDPTKHDVDWAACSTALDTAQCSGGNSPDSGTDGTDGGVEGVLLIPEECSGTAGTGGSGSTSSATSSGTM